MNNKARYALALGAFIILLLLGLHAMPKESEKIEIKKEEEERKIYVHIEGCVQSPGLIEAKEGIRLYELIELAGGNTEEADLSKINLASIVSDSQKIYIPSIDIKQGDSNNQNISTSENKFININNASGDELQTLEGIGPSIANRIIEYRKKNGYFNSIEDIMKVEGIGPSKYEKIKENITI